MLLLKCMNPLVTRQVIDWTIYIYVLHDGIIVVTFQFDKTWLKYLICIQSFCFNLKYIIQIALSINIVFYMNTQIENIVHFVLFIFLHILKSNIWCIIKAIFERFEHSSARFQTDIKDFHENALLRVISTFCACAKKLHKYCIKLFMYAITAT